MAHKSIGLVVGTERRKPATGLRRGAVAAAAEIVDAENPVLPRIHPESRADDLRPPSLTRGAVDHPVGGDAAEHGNDRRILGTYQPKSHFCIRQDVAVMQLEGLWQPQGLVDLN